MVDDVDGPRLARYIAGECTPEEAAEIRRWIAADASRAELVEALARVWEVTGRVPASSGWDVDAEWRELVAARAARQVRPLRPGASPVNGATVRLREWRPGATSWPARIAAAVVLAVAGGGLWQAVNQGRTRTPAAPQAMRVFATARGERADFHLSDGTRIMLNVESRMRLPADFGRRDRTVYLEGEAYFTVQHDSTRPFRVVAANAVTEDLGTEFAVRAYPGGPEVRVVVARGTVALRPAHGPITGTVGTVGTVGAVLSRGDLGRLDTAGVVTVRSGVRVGGYLAWTEGRLEFHNAPLWEVVPQLERWYDLDIRLADSGLAARPLTASLKTESADEMLRLLEASLDVRLEQDGRRVTFHARGSNP